MYEKSAQFYDTYYHFLDYEEASKRIHLIIQKLNPKAQTLLDVCCGTGKHLMHLKIFYRTEGLDISKEMLDVARIRLGDVTLYQANMLDFQLEHSFDAITCLFSSIANAKNLKDLNMVIDRMADHLNPQGVLIIEPWFFPERYLSGKLIADIVDQPELKIARMYIQEREGDLSILNINYLVGTPQEINYFTERHELGLFTNQEYQDAFIRAGLEVEYDAQGLFGKGLFIGRKIIRV